MWIHRRMYIGMKSLPAAGRFKEWNWLFGISELMD
jgi:hypothetical protein